MPWPLRRMEEVFNSLSVQGRYEEPNIGKGILYDREGYGMLD